MNRMLRRLLICSFLFASVFAIGQPGQWSYIGPNPYYLGGNADQFGDITFADSLTGYATDGQNGQGCGLFSRGAAPRQLPLRISDRVEDHAHQKAFTVLAPS